MKNKKWQNIFATSLVIIPICYFDDGVGRYGIILFESISSIV